MIKLLNSKVDKFSINIKGSNKEIEVLHIN
jgi:hypothetical protein